MSKNNGKASEKAYLDFLKHVMDTDPRFIVGRFPDTHDARNFLPTQPSDYYATFRGQAYLVEVKSSIDPARFPLKNISTKQLGYAMRYLKAGWKSMFIINRVPTNEWFFVSFETVFERFKSSKASWNWEELEPYKRDITHNFWSKHE